MSKNHIVIAGALVAGIALFSLVPATNKKSGRVVTIPEHAVQVADPHRR